MEEDFVNVEKFYRACNPSKTLEVSKAEDRQYYIDFSKVRGSNIIEELKRTITRLSPDEPTCQLFTGHIGCGKSTELLRLKTELEQQGFHVVYFESSQSMDMADVDVTDILLAIAHEVSQNLKAIRLNLQGNYFQSMFAEIANLIPSIELSAEATIPVGIGNITAKMKESPRLRSQLRQYLEPRTTSILEAINQELLRPATEELKQKAKKGLVVIVDNLDRMDNSVKSWGSPQPEYLFVQRGDKLKELHCHVVYTIPLVLIFSTAIGGLRNRFNGVNPKVLPMVPVQLRDGSECQEGITLLQKMILARAFPNLSWEQSRNLITQVFDNAETLNRLCQVSGGHLRNLLGLLYSCLQQQDPPISRYCVEKTIRQACNELSLPITPNEWELLRQVTRDKKFPGHEEISNMHVFEYRDDNGSWFDVNPILKEAIAFKL